MKQLILLHISIINETCAGLLQIHSFLIECTADLLSTSKLLLSDCHIQFEFPESWNVQKLGISQNLYQQKQCSLDKAIHTQYNIYLLVLTDPYRCKYGTEVPM